MGKARISPAMAISVAALFFSLAGAGAAATGYRITSLWQIAPKVRHTLRGHTGRTGNTGPQGPEGLLRWDQVGQERGEFRWLSAAEPTASTTAVCPQGDHLLNGGFWGSNDAVTESRGLGDAEPAGWSVNARLPPDAGCSGDDPCGWVQAWAECVPG